MAGWNCSRDKEISLIHHNRNWRNDHWLAVRASEDETSDAFGKSIFSLSPCIPSFRIPSYKQHDRQTFEKTTPVSSSTTILCFRNSERLWQDLLPRISPQRDWCNVLSRYFCNNNSNHFLATWENSRAVLDIIQTPSFYYVCDLYISEVEKTNSTETALNLESPSKFWGFRITYRLPVGLPLLCKRLIK